MEKLESLLAKPPSLLQLVELPVFTDAGLRFWVKRDDLLHPHVSGNKWRKLKHNLLEARRLGLAKLITFGGAYSNHLAAVAAAGREFGFSTLGIVSGEASGADNPTLGFAKACGMDLFFTSRANLRNKSETELLTLLKIDASRALVLPQGGANCLALPGCAEIVTETEAQLGHSPDFFITACGTGTTLAGIASGIAERKTTALGIPVLKGDFMHGEVANLLTHCGEKPHQNWKTLNDFHFGGYANWTPELIDFINDFKRKTGIPLDPVYTGKACFAAVKLAESGYFPKSSEIVFVHTGGLQGIAGFNQRFGQIIQ